MFRAKSGQTSYGEDIGILLLDTFVPLIKGDVGNAKSYPFPVRFKRVDGLTAKVIFTHDHSFSEKMVAAAVELEREGVRAITGDCGFMALYQKDVSSAVSIPVFLSSLLQLPFIRSILAPGKKIGVVTANAGSLIPELVSPPELLDQKYVVISGLEDTIHFRGAAIEETGDLDFNQVRDEIVAASMELSRMLEVGAILLECSLLPPYGQAVQQATKLPVFDYMTMIHYVHSALVKFTYPVELD
ncbi:MAG: aspartate/glutamate racemase family protein [SAR324 cluster bacterium]|nr:aspartate/glutamate racemase family protein [SAR324 cluster bacterium]